MVRESQNSAWLDLNMLRKRIADALMRNVDRIGAVVASSLGAEETKRSTSSSIGIFPSSVFAAFNNSFGCLSFFTIPTIR